MTEVQLKISMLLDQWHLSFTDKETEAQVIQFTKDQSQLQKVCFPELVLFWIELREIQIRQEKLL